MFWILATYAFIIGAIVGSFLNVVIHRYPAGESIVFPSSRCPRCEARIRPWDNVPIVSYILLAGRCRSCKGAISLRYPLVELSNALFYLAIFLRTGVSILFPLFAAIVSLTLLLIYIDLDIQMLPDVLDLPGVLIGLAIGAVNGPVSGSLVRSANLVDSLLGAALGGGIILLIALSYKLIRKIEGMGLGDVKMMAMIGAVVGWRPVLPILLLASCAGAGAGLLIAARERQGLQIALPFGVFLGIALIAVMFFGSQLARWYETALLS